MVQYADGWFVDSLFANTMIALEVSLNGKCVCVAGAEDLGVLTTNVSAVGKLGKKTVRARPDETTGEIFYAVGGLTSRPDPRKDVHLTWKAVTPLRIGDILQVKILETDKVDRATSRQKARRRVDKPTGSRQGRGRAAGSKQKSVGRHA